MISSAPTVTAFLKTLAPGERAVFSKIRALIRKSHPKIEENMRWRMPAFTIGENGVAGFNKQKHYLCLYIDPGVLKPFRRELKAAKLDCGKCCIRFRRPELLPLPLAARIIKAAARAAAP